MDTKPLEIFEFNVKSVEKLINFDRDVQDLMIEEIKALHRTLHDVEGIKSENRNGKKVLDFIENIRSHDSLKPRYNTILNQAVVLLVSYFGSALSDCFRCGVHAAIERKDKRVLNEEINLEIEELLLRGDQIHDILGDLIIHKKDISFQDMKSAHRAFKKYFGIEIEKNERVNNIILGQACRHVIVHEGAKVNAKTLKQISGAKPRSLKKSLKKDEELMFSVEEIKELGDYMKDYVFYLQEKISHYQDEAESENQLV